MDRQLKSPGHNQEALEQARVVQVGAGGLGIWSALGLVRAGVRYLTVVEMDWVDPTNLHRTPYTHDQAGQAKSHAAGEVLVRNAVKGSQITSIPLSFEEAAQRFTLACDLLKVDVDSNATRLAAAAWARKNRIPCVITGIDPKGG
ncbi:MAG: ThiF family adenylyltransferase [Chloroflexi bacterium]|nr:ThiF family adenylyltransferase [Chloroflexota bacterium]